jgi:hypothetical protein
LPSASGEQTVNWPDAPATASELAMPDPASVARRYDVAITLPLLLGAIAAE